MICITVNQKEEGRSNTLNISTNISLYKFKSKLSYLPVPTFLLPLLNVNEPSPVFPVLLHNLYFFLGEKNQRKQQKSINRPSLSNGTHSEIQVKPIRLLSLPSSRNQQNPFKERIMGFDLMGFVRVLCSCSEMGFLGTRCQIEAIFSARGKKKSQR